MLTNIWKTHDSSPWQNKFYQWDSKSLIEAQSYWQQSKPNSHWQQSNLNSHWQHQSPILISNTKAQFLLATPKPNSHWQHQNPIFIDTTLSKKKRVQDYQNLAKKYIMLPKQERLIASIHEETQKNVFTNKSPWGIKTHGNMRTQLSPCEQETPSENKGEWPLFSPNQRKKQTRNSYKGTKPLRMD